MITQYILGYDVYKEEYQLLKFDRTHYAYVLVASGKNYDDVKELVELLNGKCDE